MRATIFLTSALVLGGCQPVAKVTSQVDTRGQARFAATPPALAFDGVDVQSLTFTNVGRRAGTIERISFLSLIHI